MNQQGTGRIISVSSVIGETGAIGQANYAASKAGLFGLTKTLAKEALSQLARAERPAGDGVGLTVNAVTPGYIATDMVAAMPERVLDRVRSQIPAGRLGRPEEIARVVRFLAADLRQERLGHRGQRRGRRGPGQRALCRRARTAPHRTAHGL
jgi:acetoacetyl-CoA reductase/3-oxoacyl-[acyl-carrier protein] reductase